jgi:hypothetical protein
LRRIIIILFIGLGTRLTAQNLVLNPSFEDTLQCPNLLGQINRVAYWSSFTNGTPEIFSSNFCMINSSSQYIDVPSNYWGYQNARTGSNYAGLGLYSNYTSSSDREYIQVQLATPLKPSTAYCISYYVSLADKQSYYAIKNFEAYFNQDSMHINTQSPISNLYPQFFVNELLNDTTEWQLVSGYFQASGGERYMVIGNFKPQNEVDTMPVNTSLEFNRDAYYYIDDVSVMECDSLNSITENEYINAITIYPNPASAIINLSYNLKHNSTLLIYNSIGQLIEQKQLLKDSKLLELPLTTYANGLYIYTVTANGKTVYQGKFVVSK